MDSEIVLPIIILVICLVLVIAKLAGWMDEPINTASVPDNLLVARCPKCKSTSITANKQGFGVGKAAVGAVLAGPFGLLAGGIGSNKLKLNCLSCGNQWDNNGSAAQYDRELQKREILLSQSQPLQKREILLNQPHSHPLPKRYLKQSAYEKSIEAGIKGFEHDTVFIENFVADFTVGLYNQNVEVVPDEEFTRLTGKE